MTCVSGPTFVFKSSKSSLLLQVRAARQAVTPHGGPALHSGQTPQELLQIFNETQRNMMDLNEKRLAALAEVKALRARVAKLGML